MEFFPVFMRVTDRQCLVVGAGTTAYRKVGLLLKSKANIVVVSPTINSSMRQLVDSKRIHFIQKEFTVSDVNNCRLVIAATSDYAVNASVADAASRLDIPVNVVDTPDISSFIFPAIVERPPLTIAVSSGGLSPVLVRILRERLETLIPARYGALAMFARRFRALIKQSIGNVPMRRRIWEQILYGPIAELVFAGQHQEAERRLHHLLDSR